MSAPGGEGPATAGVAWLADQEASLWTVALLGYGFGDFLTTWVGLHTGRGAEAGPVAAPLVAEHGIAALLGLKLVTLACFYLVWGRFRAPTRVAVPLAVAVVGVGVTGWNVSVLLG